MASSKLVNFFCVFLLMLLIKPHFLYVTIQFYTCPMITLSITNTLLVSTRFIIYLFRFSLSGGVQKGKHNLKICAITLHKSTPSKSQFDFEVGIYMID